MEHLLQPDSGLILWTIIIFLGLVFVLKKYTWKPLIDALNGREAGIRKAIDDAQQAQQTAESLKAQYEKHLAEGQSKVDAMLKQAETDAQKLRERLMHEAEEEARRLSEQSRRQLADDKEKLARELRQEAAALSVKVAEKLLKHSITSKDQDALVQGFFKDLENDPRKAN